LGLIIGLNYAGFFHEGRDVMHYFASPENSNNRHVRFDYLSLLEIFNYFNPILQPRKEVLILFLKHLKSLTIVHENLIVCLRPWHIMFQNIINVEL